MACWRPCARSLPRPARARRGGPDHPRHDARHQRADRAQGREDRAAHHRGLPRHASRCGTSTASSSTISIIELPPPLVPRRLRLHACRERIERRGEVLLAARRSAQSQARSPRSRQGVEAIAVGFLHSFTNPAHERRVGEHPARAAARRRGDAVLAKSRRRCASTSASPPPCANAYVQPLIGRYLAGSRRARPSAASLARCC